MPHSTDERWWNVKGDPHAELVDVARRLFDKDNRRTRLLRFRNLFLDEKKMADGRASIGKRARFNVVRSLVETEMAHIAKNLPVPEVLTVGGDYSVANKAKMMTRYLAGEWDRIGADDLRTMQIFDGCIFGTGAIKHTPMFGRLSWHLTWVGDLFVHPREEVSRHVRTLYQFMPIDRTVAIERWPKHTKEIEKLDNVDQRHLDYFSASDNDDDMVMVFEAWRLPASPGKPGRRVICTDTATLVDDEWEHERFPFSWFHYSRDPMRFFGRGIPERVEGLQEEQDFLSETISDGARLLSGTKFVLTGGSTLSEDSITNEIGEFIRIEGPNPLQVLQPSPAAPELMGYAERQRESIYEIEGISRMAAQSVKPAGLNSGKALMVHNDLQSERGAMRSKSVESATIEAAKLDIMICEQIHGGRDDDEESEEAEDADDAVYYTDDDGVLEEIRYSKIRLGNHPSTVRVFPVSALSSTPQGKLSQLAELLQIEAITVQEFRELYDFPDLDRSADLEHAARNLSRKLVEKAVEGELVPATRVADLGFLIRHGWQQHALLQTTRGATDEDLVTLRHLIGHAEALLQQEAEEEARKMQAMQPPAPPMPAPMSGPMPMPMPTPMPMPGPMPGPMPMPDLPAGGPIQ